MPDVAASFEFERVHRLYVTGCAVVEKRIPGRTVKELVVVERLADEGLFRCIPRIPRADVAGRTVLQLLFSLVAMEMLECVEPRRADRHHDGRQHNLFHRHGAFSNDRESHFVSRLSDSYQNSQLIRIDEQLIVELVEYVISLQARCGRRTAIHNVLDKEPDTCR